MVLLLLDDFSQDLTERKFAHGVGLANPLLIIDDRLPLIFQVKLEHLFRFVGGFDFFWHGGRACRLSSRSAGQFGWHD